jgi:hypothetical protein
LKSGFSKEGNRVSANQLARSGLIAAGVSVLLASVAFAGQSSSHLRLAASPSHIGSRGRVVVRGSGWSEGPGCQKKVHLLAYVVGISPYPTVTVGTGSLSGGHFIVGWRAPKVEDGLEWTIRGEQKCATTTIVAHTTLTIS